MKQRLILILMLATARTALAENIIFPASSGVVDVTAAPYNARGTIIT